MRLQFCSVFGGIEVLPVLAVIKLSNCQDQGRFYLIDCCVQAVTISSLVGRVLLIVLRE